jgi:type IV pilus assembly protein PilN
MMAPPFRINLGSNRRPYLVPLRTGLILLSVLFTALIAWDLHQVDVLHEQAAATELSLARVREQDERLVAQAKADSLDLSEARLQKLPQDVAFANQLIAKRAFSWTDFLNDLEAAVPSGVAIQNIRLDVKNSSIAMGGSARSLKHLTSLIISLEDHPAFQDAILGQHRTLDSGFVDFTLTVRYKRRPGAA